LNQNLKLSFLRKDLEEEQNQEYGEYDRGRTQLPDPDDLSVFLVLPELLALRG